MRTGDVYATRAGCGRRRCLLIRVFQRGHCRLLQTGKTFHPPACGLIRVICATSSRLDNLLTIHERWGFIRNNTKQQQK